MERPKKCARLSANDYPASGQCGAQPRKQSLGLLDVNVDVLLSITTFLIPPEILVLRETCKVLCSAIDETRTHIVLHLAHVQQALFLDRCERAASCSTCASPPVRHAPSPQAAASASLSAGPAPPSDSACPHAAATLPKSSPLPCKAEPYRSSILSAFDKWPRLRKVYVLGDMPESCITRLVQDAVAAGRLEDLVRILIQLAQWRNNLTSIAVSALVACESALLGAITDAQAVAQLEALDLPRPPPPPPPPPQADAAVAAAAAVGAVEIADVEDDGGGAQLPSLLLHIPDPRIRDPVAQSLIHWLVHFAAALAYSGAYDEAARVARLLWVTPLADAVRATLASVQLARQRPLDAARTVLSMQPRHARALAVVLQEAIPQLRLKEQRKRMSQELPLPHHQREHLHQEGLQQQSQEQQLQPSPDAAARPDLGCTGNGARKLEDTSALDEGGKLAAGSATAAEDRGGAAATAVPLTAAPAMACAPPEVRELHAQMAALAVGDGGMGGGGGGLAAQMAAGIAGLSFGWHGVLLGSPSPLVLAFAEAVAACAYGRPESGLGLLHLHWLRWQLQGEKQRNELLKRLVKLQRRVARLRLHMLLGGGGGSSDDAAAGQATAGRSDSSDQDSYAEGGAADGGPVGGPGEDSDRGELAGGSDGLGHGGADGGDGGYGGGRVDGGNDDYYLTGWIELATVDDLREVRRELFMLDRRLSGEQDDFSAAINEYVNKHLLPAGRVHRYSACWGPGVDAVSELTAAETAAAAAVDAASPAVEAPLAASLPLSPSTSQADVLSQLIRMVYRQPCSSPTTDRSSSCTATSFAATASAALEAGPSTAPVSIPSSKLAVGSGSTTLPPSRSSSPSPFEISVRETLASAAALLLLGSGYVSAATRLLVVAPLTSHLHRASLLDRMWALIGAGSTWVRALPYHAQVVDGAGQLVKLDGTMDELEAMSGSRVCFLESRRFWLLGPEDEDDEDEDAMDVEENEEMDQEGPEEEGEEGGDMEEEGQVDAAPHGHAGAVEAAVGLLGHEAGHVVDAGQVPPGLNGGAGGYAGPEAHEGGADAAAGAEDVDFANAGGGGDGDAVPVGGDGGDGDNQVLVPDIQHPPGAEPPQQQQLPPQPAQPQHQQGFGQQANVEEEAPQGAPAAVDQAQNAAAAAAVAAGDDEQRARGVGLLSQAVEFQWSISAPWCTSDVNSSHFPLGIRGPHPCRGFRAQPALIDHVEAILTAVLQVDCGGTGTGGGSGGCDHNGYGSEPAVTAVVAGDEDPHLFPQGPLVGNGITGASGTAPPPPGSCAVWQASLATLMAACASAPDVQRRSLAVVMAMTDVRARLASAVAVAAELVQQSQTSLAGELVLTAYGTPPDALSTAHASATNAPMAIDCGGAGPGCSSSFQSPSSTPHSLQASDHLASLKFNMCVSGQPALLWACAHLNRAVQLATDLAHVRAQTSVWHSQHGHLTANAASPIASSADEDLDAEDAAARFRREVAVQEAAPECFPVEQARALVPLMRILPVPFLERCLAEAPSMLNPTDLARQLLLTSLGRTVPVMGSEDTALALRQLIYYSRLSLGISGLRPQPEISPMEGELTSVSMQLSSLIRLIDAPVELVSRGVRPGPTGLVVAEGPHAPGEGVQPFMAGLEDEEEDEEAGGNMGVGQQQEDVAMGVAEEDDTGVIVVSDWAGLGEWEEDEQEVVEGESGEGDGLGDFATGGDDDVMAEPATVSGLASVPGAAAPPVDGVALNLEAAVETAPAPRRWGIYPLDLHHLDEQSLQRLRLAPSVLRDLVSEAQAAGILSPLHTGAGTDAMAAETATATAAATSSSRCNSRGGGDDDAVIHMSATLAAEGGELPSAAAAWHRWSPGLIACRRLPYLLQRALLLEDRSLLGPLLARMTGALVSWDLPYAVVLAVHTAQALGPEVLGESGVDMAVSALERLCQVCSRYYFARNALRSGDEHCSIPLVQGDRQVTGVARSAREGGRTAAAAEEFAGRGCRRRWQEMARPHRPRVPGLPCSRIPKPRTSWCMVAELLVHCFAPFWRQRLSAVVVGLSSMVVGLPARDRVGPMAKLFLLAAAGTPAPAPPLDAPWEASAVVQQLRQKLQEHRHRLPCNDDSSAAPSPPEAHPPPQVASGAATVAGPIEYSGDAVAGSPVPWVMPFVGERDSLLFMLYEVAHPWQRQLYELAAVVWGGEMVSQLLPPPPPTCRPACCAAGRGIVGKSAAVDQPGDLLATEVAAMDSSASDSSASAATAATPVGAGRFRTDSDQFHLPRGSMTTPQPLLPLSLHLSEGLEACFANNCPLTRAVMLFTTVVLAAMELQPYTADHSKVLPPPQTPRPPPPPPDQPHQLHAPWEAAIPVLEAAEDAALAAEGMDIEAAAVEVARCQHARLLLWGGEVVSPRRQVVSLLGLIRVLKVPRVVLTTMLEGLLTLYLPRTAHRPPSVSSQAAAAPGHYVPHLNNKPISGSANVTQPIATAAATATTVAGSARCESMGMHGAGGLCTDAVAASLATCPGVDGGSSTTPGAALHPEARTAPEEESGGRRMFLMMAHLVMQLIREGYPPGPPPYMPRLLAALQRARVGLGGADMYTNQREESEQQQQEDEQQQQQRWQRQQHCKEDQEMAALGVTCSVADDDGRGCWARGWRDGGQMVGRGASAGQAAVSEEADPCEERGRWATGSGQGVEVGVAQESGSTSDSGMKSLGGGGSSGSGVVHGSANGAALASDQIRERVAQVERLLGELGWEILCSGSGCAASGVPSGSSEAAGVGRTGGRSRDGLGDREG